MNALWTRQGLLAVMIVVVLTVGGVLLAYRMQPRPQPPPFAQPSVSPAATVAEESVGEKSDRPVRFANLLELRDGEHALAPLIRFADYALETIDADIQDYSATLTKRERVGKKLLDPQTLHVKIRHEPFSAYLYFRDPFEGQECLFVEGKNDGKMLCRAGGWKKSLGVLTLDPKGLVAMNGQRYPIQKIGIRILAADLKQVASENLGIEDCEVKTSGGIRIDGRPVTLIEVSHSQRGPHVRFSMAKIYVDNEWGIPVRYTSWTWPDDPDKEPLLEEEYAYTDLQINQGFSDDTFCQENPEMFR